MSDEAVPATTDMAPMTRQHVAYDEARKALSDPDRSIQVLTAVIDLLVVQQARRRSMTNAELFRLDVMQREAHERIPQELHEAIERWALELVGMDPNSVVTR